jgi:glycerophosphoryl diester phosphodiesterase
MRWCLAWQKPCAASAGPVARFSEPFALSQKFNPLLLILLPCHAKGRWCKEWTMQNAILVERNGHRTWLKWHRGRKTFSDTVFTGDRLMEAMQTGASVEVDLRVHAEGGFAILHDDDIARETTGTGFVRDLGAEDLRSLSLRDNQDEPTEHGVMLLEDLVQMLGTVSIHKDAMLQLDFKDDVHSLDDGVIANFIEIVTPFARNMILSSGDAEAVALLSKGIPDLNIGYDPCSDEALDQLLLVQNPDFERFVLEAVQASPNASMIYLYYPLVLEAAERGYDLVGAFHARNRTVDAWTVRDSSPDSLESVHILLACKVDQITTDDPAGLAARLKDAACAAA